MKYNAFIQTKLQDHGNCGFEPSELPDWLYDFQKYLVEWALQKGRAAIFADCGLGKTPMQLAWADQVVRKTNGRVLIMTPLAVSVQTVRESQKFGVECNRSSDGTVDGDITVTNYERLRYFSPDDFVGVVADESSIIKNFAGKRRAEITEFMRTIPYRLLCTATAAPNDYHELGTSSEALGYLGYTDMLTRFFKEDIVKDYLGWGRKKYRFRGHAELPFWRWVCSWARSMRRPSDLGFDDTRFILPPLVENEYLIEDATPRDGMLFSIPARDLKEQRDERRTTLPERCQAAAERATNNGATVLWCHLNKEADELERLIPDALQVSGSMPDEKKEERLLAFQAGELQTLITKPKIGCFGLNWQHCHNVVSFPSHSWEQYYQAVRRCWRFGQTEPVTVSIITTEGEVGVLRNLQRKAKQADDMFDSLTACMGDALHIKSDTEFDTKEELPSWL
jgi:SNF2 family DNA or RNA helicase